MASANQVRFIGNALYTTTYTDPSFLYAINSTTGVGTQIASTGLTRDNGLIGYLNGSLLTVASEGRGVNQFFWIDPATGAATAGADTVSGVATLIPAANTPEPKSLTLLAVAAGMLLMWPKSFVNRFALGLGRKCAALPFRNLRRIF